MGRPTHIFLTELHRKAVTRLLEHKSVMNKYFFLILGVTHLNIGLLCFSNWGKKIQKVTVCGFVNYVPSDLCFNLMQQVFKIRSLHKQ